MIETVIIGLCKQALLLIIILSAPAVLVSLFVGLAVSLFQATTQIQDQSLSYVPKLVGVLLALVVFGTWGAKHSINFATELLGKFHQIVK